MKKSIRYLPKNKQEELKSITELIIEKVPETVMIILFGSYATNSYVDYDQRIEYGIPTFFRSDYDILVLTEKKRGKTVKNQNDSASRRLIRVDDKFSEGKHYSQVTPLSFITDTIDEFNKAISDRHYFYTGIKKRGILLYDNKKYKLDRARKLNYQEIRNLAQRYYDDKLQIATTFYKDAKSNYKEGNYKQASFYLHQSVENSLHGVLLTFTLNSPKEHKLYKLIGYTKKYFPQSFEIFTCHTPEEIRLFDLLEDAYKEARYNIDFIVDRKDIEALLPKVEMLLKATSEICVQQISNFELNV